MDFEDFVAKTDLCCKTEIERIKLVAFFKVKFENKKEFDLITTLELLTSVGAGISNHSRLKQNLTKSKDFRKNNKTGNWTLNANIVKSMQMEFKDKLEDKNSIESNNELLDEKLFSGKRTYLDKLISQVNNTYKNHCYDACAVLLRRIFEIMLIHMFENNKLESSIRDNNGDYKMLNNIVEKTVENKTILGLSRGVKEDYEKIRNLGNYAAHRIHYNTRDTDIDDIRQIYRVRLEELYHKAGLIK